MKKIFLFLITIGFSLSMNGQTIFGKWENRDEKTNKVNSIIEVFEKNGKAFAKVIEIIDKEKQDLLCTECKGKRKNTPILGMTILTGLSKDNSEWSGGKILDPKNGKEYKCYIKLEGNNKLKIRGYIGFAALGRTAYWYKK